MCPQCHLPKYRCIPGRWQMSPRHRYRRLQEHVVLHDTVVVGVASGEHGGTRGAAGEGGDVEVLKQAPPTGEIVQGGSGDDVIARGSQAGGGLLVGHDKQDVGTPRGLRFSGTGDAGGEGHAGAPHRPDKLPAIHGHELPLPCGGRRGGGGSGPWLSRPDAGPSSSEVRPRTPLRRKCHSESVRSQGEQLEESPGAQREPSLSRCARFTFRMT